MGAQRPMQASATRPNSLPPYAAEWAHVATTGPVLAGPEPLAYIGPTLNALGPFMPRLKVNLTEEQHAQLQHVALATGQSMSAVLQDLFVMAAPTLKRIADMAIAARQAPEEFHKGMVASLEAAEARLAPLMAQAAHAFDEASQAVHKPGKRPPRAAEGSPPAGRRRGVRGGQPPLSNTGVRSTHTAQKTRSRGSL